MSKKPYQEMSEQELLAEIAAIHKRIKFKPRQLIQDENGMVLLNPDHKQDRDWYENDKEYNFSTG